MSVISSKLDKFPSFGGGVGGWDGLHNYRNFVWVNFYQNQSDINGKQTHKLCDTGAVDDERR